MTNILENIYKQNVWKEETEIKTIYASKLYQPAQILLNELGRIVPNIIDNAGYDNIQYGIWYEQHLINKLRKQEMVISPSLDNLEQIRVIEGVVKGKIDIYLNMPDNKKVIVEVKTCKNLPDEPKIEHLWQIGYYVAYHPCDYGILHYGNYSKESRDFIIEKTNPIILEVRKKVDLINKLHAQGNNCFEEL